MLASNFSQLRSVCELISALVHGECLVEHDCLSAVGDIHGDIQKTFLALALAGVLREGIGKESIWCGGNSTVVQLGDVLDRGSREIGG